MTGAEPYALVIGESLIDIVAKAGESAAEFPGGSPLNVAVGLGRLGRPTTLVTWIGRDARGAAIEAHLAESHVTLAPGSDGADHTSTALAAIDVAGQATYTFDIDNRMPPGLRDGIDLPGDKETGAGNLPSESTDPLVVHTGSIGALVDPGATDVADYLVTLRGRTTVCFDPNCRPSIMGAADDVRPRVERLVASADIVKASDEDLAWLYGPEREPSYWAAHWLTLGPKLVVVTCGGEGAYAVTHGTVVEVPADTSLPVADTVGAGDSFMAGLIHALWTRGRLGAPAALDGLTVAELRTVLAQATAIAAITVSRPGANPPWLDELT